MTSALHGLFVFFALMPSTTPLSPQRSLCHVNYTAWSASCSVNYRPHSLPRQRSIVACELHSMVCFMQYM